MDDIEVEQLMDVLAENFVTALKCYGGKNVTGLSEALQEIKTTAEHALEALR